MKRVCVWTAIIFAMAALGACSNSSDGSGSPTSPTPGGSSPTVRAVIVSAAQTSNTTYQMTAKADLSDGTSHDVTTQSQWSTSNANVATISSGGVLTVVHSGQIEVRATFQNITGSLPMTVDAVQPPSGTFILAGHVHGPMPEAAPIAGATIRITSGPDAGKSVTSAEDGQFGFVAVQGGTINLEAEKAGFQKWQMTNFVLDRDREIDVTLNPTTTSSSR